MVFAVAFLGALLAAEPAVARESSNTSSATPVHTVSADAAPLYLAWWPGHHDDGYSDSLNIDPEGSLSSIGLKLEYGNRLTRRFELAGGVEYLRTPAFDSPSAHHVRATTTPSVVFGNGRRYDFSLGARVGLSGIRVMGDWAAQITTLAVLRNRVWVHENVGLMLSASSGVHFGVGEGTGGLNRLTTFELIALRVGVATRF